MKSSNLAPVPPAPRAVGRQVSSCLTDLYETRLRHNELIAASCRDCNRDTFPAADRCNHCHSSRLDPITLSGGGQLRTAKVARSRDELSVGHVVLDEGIAVRAPLAGEFRNRHVLLRALSDGPVEVEARVVITHGLAILTFVPG